MQTKSLITRIINEKHYRRIQGQRSKYLWLGKEEQEHLYNEVAYLYKCTLEQAKPWFESDLGLTVVEMERYSYLEIN